MAGSNYSDSSKGFYEAVTDSEVATRLEIVRRLKESVGGRDLTPEELDRVIEPTPCRRTRLRLKRK